MTGSAGTSSGSSFSSVLSYVGIGIAVLVVLLTLIGAIKGRKRGIGRQLVRSLTIVASVFISFAVVNMGYNYITSMVSSQGVSGFLSNFGIALDGDSSEIFAKVDPETFNHILAIPLALVVLPLTFSITFIEISALMLIVYALICKIFRLSKKENTKITKLFGMILGAIQGFAVAVIVLVFIVGPSSMISEAVKDMEATNPNSESTAEVKEIYTEYIQPVAEHPAVTLLGSMGGNMLYEKIATINVNGTTYNMKEEVASPTLKLISAYSDITGIDFENMSEEDKATFNLLIEVVNDSPYMATLLADVLSTVAKTAGDESEPDALTNAVLSIFVDMKGENVAPTLELVRDAIFLTSVEWSDMSENDENNVNALIDSIKKNSYKAGVLATLLDAVATSIKEESADEEGGELISAILTVFIDIEGKEVAPTLELILDVMFLSGATDWKTDIPDEDRAALDALIESAEEDSYKADTLATILDAIAKTFEEDTSDDMAKENELDQELMQKLFSVFLGISGEEVAPTLQVIRNVLFMLDDEGALAALGEDASLLVDIFSKQDDEGHTLINKITAEFNSEDRTKPLVSSITKISISIMADKSQGDITVTEETYENVKTGVKDIAAINKTYEDAAPGTPEYEEYKSAVSDTLSDTFVDNGFEVEKEVVDEMANYVAENYKDKMEDLSDEDIDTIILNYYSAYLQSGQIPTPPAN